MSNSFVEGYASRSDEKGFEGASGGKQSTTKVEKDKFIHENHPGLLFINMKKNHAAISPFNNSTCLE